MVGTEFLLLQVQRQGGGSADRQGKTEHQVEGGQKKVARDQTFGDLNTLRHMILVALIVALILSDYCDIGTSGRKRAQKTS